MPDFAREYKFYTKSVERQFTEMEAILNASVDKDAQTLAAREALLKERLQSVVADLPTEAAAVGAVLSITDRKAITAATKRMFSIVEAMDNTALSKLGADTFSQGSLSIIRKANLRSMTVMAKRHWKDTLGALKNPDLYSEAVVAEAKELIQAQRIAAETLEDILGAKESKAAYGQASNIFALMQDA